MIICKSLARGPVLGLALVGLAFATSSFAGTGALDTSFGTAGVASVPGYSLAVQGDDKVVALGAGFATGFGISSSIFSLRRLTVAGGIDFATSSPVFSCGFCSLGSSTSATALQADGRIVSVGTAEQIGLNTGACKDVYYIVMRHLATGGIDPGFGVGGVVTLNFGQARSVAMQADGKIVVAGSKTSTGCFRADGPLDSALVRLNVDGTLDPTFGVAGRVTTSLSNANDMANAVAIQPDGKIVVAGYAFNGTSNDLSIARYGATGVLEESALHDMTAGASDVAYALALQADGKIVAGGASGTNAALLRLSAPATLDSGFASAGKFLVPGAPVVGVALQPDAKLVAATADGDVLRMLASGTLDASFGIGGRLSLALAFNSVALQADGKIIAGGSSVVVRIDPTATLPITPSPVSVDFGGQSVQTTAPAQAVTITNTSGGAQTIASITAVAEYPVTHDCATLAVGASCTATVSFTPTAAGARNASLVVAGSAGTQKVFLWGAGELSLVTHYYRAILNRAPDAMGKSYWEGEFARLATLGADPIETWYVLAGYFFSSVEYASFAKTDAQFVTDLYKTFFNRAPDGGGLGYWVGQIQGGLPREVVLFSFMFSPEFRTFTQGIFGSTAARPEVNVVMDFFRGILNRLPDTSSFQYWTGRMRAAQCAGAGPVYTEVNAISGAFIFNPEYNSRSRSNTQFVTDMYYSFLRRGGDAGGVSYWIDQLQGGAMSVDTVRTNFLNSPEFGARVQAVIAAGCYSGP